jgi:hypothetical protein
MMNNEQLLKLRCHSVSTIINFVKGFLNENEEEDESKNANKIMETY